MKKTFKRPQEESQKVWKNMSHEGLFNPFRKYYVFVEIDGVEIVLDYIGKFRSEAVAYFEEQARINQGKLTSAIHVYK